jgi:NitT/TauT family transport system substrate-binding protein
MSNFKPGFNPGRREVLLGVAAGLALDISGIGALLAWPVPVLASGVSRVRLSLPLAGTAGAVWRPVVAAGKVEAPAALQLDYVGGDPGQVQTQLLAGAVDVAACGPLGAAQANQRGGDLVMFAPALNNHGSFVVHGDSGYRTLAQLKGRRIASQPPTSDTYRQARLALRLHGLDLQNDFQVIHGPPIANLALFQRRDVDAVLTIEPTSTRLIAKGAREIGTVGELWRQGTGDAAPLLLIGQAARRDWIEANRATAAKLARFYQSINQTISASPGILKELHVEFGIPSNETAAIDLLPKRLAGIYATRWDQAVFTDIDRQLQEAVRLGILPALPAHPLYQTLSA